MLADITNKPENQRYSNLQVYFKGSESASISNENPIHNTTVVHDCTDEKHSKSENSDIDLSDQDPTYKAPSKNKRKIPVYLSQSKSSGSSSSSKSSSSSPSSRSSSDSSDTDSSDEQNETQNNIVQVTAEKQSEQININEPATKEVSLNQDIGENTTPQEEKKKGRKRKRNEESWKQNEAKTLRNAGKRYISKKNKVIKPRSVQPPCGNQCRLKCCEKITVDQRQTIFDVYWNLGQVDAQRSFIMSCITNISPRYKYTNARNPRNCNQAFHFLVEGQSVRVCKTFFMKTLDISDRAIRTVKSKIDEHGILAQDLRGHHSNHVRVDEELLNDIKQFIDAIPRIESHYIRQYSTREYIDGGKTISDLFRDFKENQNQNNKAAGKYCTFYKVFTQDYNISFFRPRKDQCDLCMQYKNSTPEQKVLLKESYDTHLEEKTLSRQEKHDDRCKIDDKNKVLVFDLQAVLQSPRGTTSGFYYKSKLNSYNFTITMLNKKVDGQIKDSYDDVHCFFWNETDAKRGANEIGSCLLKVFEKLSAESPNDNGCNLILYSDNCAGQNKNKFIVALYLYAVTHLNIKSITHKFLIKGHTQNEGDNIHSLIEKEITKNLKSGPIYSPHQYVAIIKNAKKSGKKFLVHELTFESFLDLKKLQEDWGFNFNKTKDGETVSWNELKVIKVSKDTPFSFFVKTSYRDSEYQEVRIRNTRKKMLPLSEIVSTKYVYISKQELSENKKKDLRELLSKKLIPNFYSDFYNSII
ncbi:uncharacterized protein LOC134200558 [Bombyx mori]|uniref:uncharacterized protein LOC134200558 n=1 Tax=Bombyx mori TaxID=7091 RepID=UPI002ED06BFB